MAGRPEPGRRLAFVAAHPDDDTFGIAGSVALHAHDPRFHFTLIHATDGEAGQISEGSNATPETLGAVRRLEARSSWAILGRAPDRHEWLGYPDSALAEVDLEELTDRIAAVFADERPDVVVTFGPDGMTLHPDHIAVGRAATAAFLRFVDDGGPGFQRLVHAAIRASTMQRWNRERVAAGLPPWETGRLYHPQSVEDELIGLDADTSTVAPRVLEALRAHRTQWDTFEVVDEALLIRLLSREQGVIAHPPRRPGEPVFTDVFEDIPAPTLDAT